MCRALGNSCLPETFSQMRVSQQAAGRLIFLFPIRLQTVWRKPCTSLQSEIPRRQQLLRSEHNTQQADSCAYSPSLVSSPQDGGSVPQAIEVSTDAGALLISVRVAFREIPMPLSACLALWRRAADYVSGSDPLAPSHGMPMEYREGSSTIHGTPKYSN